MNWIDLVALVLVVAAAVWGWRSGAVIQVLTMVGFWLGLVIGTLLVLLVGHHVSGDVRLVLVLGLLFGCAFLFGAFGEWGGRRLGRSLRHRLLGPVDQVLGSAVAVIVSLLVIWIAGTLLAASAVPTVNEAVSRSSVLRTISSTMPPLPDLFARLESLLSNGSFPVVFVNPPAGLVAPAPLPDAQATAAAAAAAGASTVKVAAQGCALAKTGSGFVAGPGLVITNAHVVAGESATQVDDRAGSHGATVVAFDPRLDVAVLRVPDLNDPPLAIRTQLVARGTTAAILGYPGGNAFHAEPSAVNGRFEAVGLDIYGTGLTAREVYELNGVVVPGNSGGPLVATGQPSGTAGIPVGTVIGLIFGNSPSDPGTGYALAMDAVSAELARAGDQPVSTGPCLS